MLLVNVPMWFSAIWKVRRHSLLAYCVAFHCVAWRVAWHCVAIQAALVCEFCGWRQGGLVRSSGGWRFACRGRLELDCFADPEVWLCYCFRKCCLCMCACIFLHEAAPLALVSAVFRPGVSGFVSLFRRLSLPEARSPVEAS
ncbi:unnamed protein product [Phaeothamnion confervicola]